ncbi:MAG TPA: hypothetical protein VFB15_05115 [Candidatus Binataceae bacterium]|jgi:hypothetical protein|nr:hypothetical protein [Candidatus Binataceae bacterium]
MTCLETRRSYAAFWRQALAREARSEFLNHLASCARCDRSFRHFALTAPVLHDDPRELSLDALNEGGGEPRIERSGFRRKIWGAMGGAFAVAAAAAIAFCFFRPLHATFEDAFTEDSGLELTAYPAPDESVGHDHPTPVAWIESGE